MTRLPDQNSADGLQRGLESFISSAETCERCGRKVACVATVGRDWSERHCEVCASLSADKGHYVRYDAGGEENS